MTSLSTAPEEPPLKPCWTYRIRNLLDSTFYIGATVNPKRRWYKHRTQSSNSPLSQAMARDGLSNFEFTVLEQYPSEDEAYDAETALISTMKICGQALYNIDGGGRSGYGRKGYKKSPETLAKLVKSMTGRKASEETKRKMGAKSAARQIPKVRVRAAKNRFQVLFRGKVLKSFPSWDEAEAFREAEQDSGKYS